MALEIGIKAPEFSLYSSAKELISLSDFKGKNVVMLFFPQAFTGVCTTELCGVRDTMHTYQALNAEVLAISVDSLFTQAKFKADQNFTFTFLSDFNKEVSKMYDAYFEEFAFGMRGVSKRAVYIINAEGNIAYADVLDVAGDMPDFDLVKAALEKLN